MIGQERRYMNLRSSKSWILSWFCIQDGLSYSKIFKYFYPECISALIIYFLPYCIDCLFICQLQSTSSYAISGIVDNFLTIFLKASEGLSVGIIIVAGYYNGLSDFKQAGQAFVDAFWTILFLGGIVSIGIYFSGFAICSFNNFSDEMICQSIPYLRYKAMSIFFMFMYFALVGFLRAIKNTFVPMMVFASGAVVFVVVDYALIFGAFGMPELCLLGSAVASLVQYFFMAALMMIYILYASKHEKYHISILKSGFSWRRTAKLLWVSIPVVIDKVSIAFAYAWLGSCMSHLGSVAGAAFSCIKMMERFAFVPAIACAQVITFLVSNDVGRGNWNDIYSNIKRVLMISMVMVGTILLIASIWPFWFVSFFDKQHEFGHLVATIFPVLSVLILIDLLQLILSGALRGAGDVQTVMFTRVIVISCYFMPATYVISWLSWNAMVTKMLVTYVTFLLGNAIMSIVYVYRLRKNHWHKRKEKACNG
jgi:multidrug resistance protein, MATE family